MSRPRLLPIVCAALAAHAVATTAWPVSAALFVLALGSALAPIAGPTGRAGRLALHAAGASLAGIGVVLLPMPPLAAADPVGAVGTTIASLSLGAAVVGLLLRVPLDAPVSPALLSLIAVVACGAARTNRLYVGTVAAFGLALAWTFSRDPRGGPGWRVLDRKRLFATLVGLAGGLTVAAGLVVGLRPAGNVVADWLMRRGRLESSAGLSDQVSLQRTTNIETTDEVVLRVYGSGGDLLRGFVQNLYRAGRWRRDGTARFHDVSGLARAPAAAPGRAILVPARATRQYLFPLDGAPVWLARDRAVVDQYGVWRPPPGESAAEAAFTVDPSGATQPDPPSAADTALTPEIAAPLAELARGWTDPARPAGQRLAQLVARLNDGFGYALKHQRKTSLDPVLDFLLHNHVGHCEYFASALALLARAAGIPARVVTGYRAHELNPIGGYRVVRERDAHAWVEAWHDGRWKTYDPTPLSYLETQANRTSWLPGLLDWAVTRWREKAGRAFPTIVRVAGLGLAAALVIRLARKLRGRRRKARAGVSAAEERPWPELEELLRVLAARGFPREPWESLELLGRRLREKGQQPAELIEAYARFRYGGIGARDTLEEGIRRALGGPPS